MHRTRFFLAASLAFAAILFADAGARGAEVLKLVPDDAVMVISVPGTGQLAESVSFFADAVAPGSSDNLSEQVAKFYTFNTGVRDGLDGEAPAAIILLLRETAAPEGADDGAVRAPSVPVIAEDGSMEIVVEPVPQEQPEPMEGVEPIFIIILPLADEATWRAAMGERILRDEGDAYEQIAGAFGPDAYFTIRDGHVVAAENAEALDEWSGLLAVGLSSGRAGKIESALGRAALCVELSLETLLRLQPEILDLFDAAVSDMVDAADDDESIGGPSRREMVLIYATMLRGVAADVKTLLVEVNPSTSGISLAMNLDAVEGSLFGEIFAAQRAIDLSALEEVPERSFLFGAMGLGYEPLEDYFTAFYKKLLLSMAPDATPEDIESAMASYNTIMEGSQRLGLLENVSFAAMKGEDAGLEILATYKTDSPAEAVEMISSGMQSVYGNPVGLKMGAFSGLAPQPPEMSEETIATRQVTVIKQFLGGEETDPFIVKVVEAVYGNPMTTRMAAGDGRLLLTLGGSGALMQEMLEGAQAHMSADVVARSLSSLSAEASCVMLASVPDLMMFGMSIGMAAEGNAVEMPPLQLPPASQLLAGAASFDGPTARLELNVPVEQINAAKMVFMQAMMMKMQQDMGGTPAEQDDSPEPWEPEGE